MISPRKNMEFKTNFVLRQNNKLRYLHYLIFNYFEEIRKVYFPLPYLLTLIKNIYGINYV